MVLLLFAMEEVINLLINLVKNTLKGGATAMLIENLQN